MKKYLLISFFVLVCATKISAAALFQNGKTDWKIYLAGNVGEVEKYAASELQQALKKISGADIQITNQVDSEEKNLVIIGSLENSQHIRDKAVSLSLSQDIVEQLAVYNLDNNLYLAGNQPRAALYAVYYFLQKELGVRWFWPGDDGEFIAKRDSYTPTNLTYNYKPAFRFREMTPCGMHYHVPTEIWLARNFMNGGSRTPAVREKAGFYSLDGQHWVALNKKDFEKYPEYFSLINNQRVPEGSAGCWSNPGFTKIMVDKHIKVINDRKLEIVNTFPADITQRCECEECTVNPDPSSRWFNYYTKLIKEIKKTCPTTMFAGIAYQEYRSVPTENVEGLEYVEYCQYNRCYVHKFDDPTCVLNKKSLEELERWQEKAPMGIYGYEFDVFKPSMYLPFWNMLAEEMKVFKEKKLVRMKTELSVRHSKDLEREEIPQQKMRLANYLYAQLCWNPDADVDILLQDWCNVVYGPGADAMLQYHRAMAKSWDNMKIHLTYFGANPGGAAKNLLNDELISFAKKQFGIARTKVAQAPANVETERFNAEIDLEESFFENWEKTFRLAAENSKLLILPLLTADNEFHNLANFPMQSKENKHHPTDLKMYWSTSALHIQVTCQEPDMKNLRYGKKGKDINLWSDDSIEIFLDFNDSSAYRQLAVNPNGGKYDAIGNDKSWNPEWLSTTELLDDAWIMNITLPFAALEKFPKADDQWKITIIRNSKPTACGFPAPAHKDLSQAATIHFSSNNNPDFRLSWLSSPALADGKRFERLSTSFHKAGWQTQNVIGAKNADSLDFNNSKVIVVENYQNRIDLDFYKKQLIPAIKKGAIVIYSCYFWTDKLQEEFADPSFEIKFVENASRVRKPSWIFSEGFIDTPNDMTKTLQHTPSGNFIAAYPEKWQELARQKNKDGEDQAFILARPLGLGMVVVAGDIVQSPKLLENILIFNKTIKR